VTTGQRQEPTTASELADLLEQFRAPGQPLHGLDAADAERILCEVIEQLLVRAIEARGPVRARN
jgi:hypothetical protein